MFIVSTPLNSYYYHLPYLGTILSGEKTLDNVCGQTWFHKVLESPEIVSSFECNYISISKESMIQRKLGPDLSVI